MKGTGRLRRRLDLGEKINPLSPWRVGKNHNLTRQHRMVFRHLPQYGVANTGKNGGVAIGVIPEPARPDKKSQMSLKI